MSSPPRHATRQAARDQSPVQARAVVSSYLQVVEAPLLGSPGEAADMLEQGVQLGSRGGEAPLRTSQPTPVGESSRRPLRLLPLPPQVQGLPRCWRQQRWDQGSCLLSLRPRTSGELRLGRLLWQGGLLVGETLPAQASCRWCCR